MSEDGNCPFCDSSDERIIERTAGSWENIYNIISDYFSNFTILHFKKLCDSCFTYIHNFYKCRNVWSTHEGIINKRRQLGQFKGLKDIVSMKKKSSLVCRLCFKECNSDDVIFIYLENKIYQPGYIKNIMTLHVNNIDLRLTENPVICQECLNAIQTFDALYQMCLENQASKVQPELKVKSSDASKNCVNQDDPEKVVHVQLKKNSNNLLVLHSISEDENAVNTLIKNKESPDSSVLLNGWTTKKVYDIFHKPKSSEKIKENPDVFVISDEEDTENKSANGGTCTDGDSTNVDSPEFIDDISADSLQCNEKIFKEFESCPLETKLSAPDVIEIDDSDEELSGFPKIVNVTSLIESELTTESPLQYNSGTDGNDDEEVEINTEAFNRSLKEYSELDDFIEGSNLETSVLTSDENSTNSNVPFPLRNQTKDVLEENLSDFLQFNKNDSNSDAFKGRNSSITSQEMGKKRRHEAIASTNSVFKDRTGSYSTVFEDFVIHQESKFSKKFSAWKLLRGFISYSNDDEYCIWFPFYPQDKKYYQWNKKKTTVTVIENRQGSRFYRCNICLFIMKQKTQVDDHKCVSLRGKRSQVCAEPKCSFYTYNDFLFSQHKKAHTLLSSDEIQDYKCNFCEFYSSDKEYMANHKKISHDSGKLQGIVSKCTFCFFQSMNPDILEHHISVRHKFKKTKFTEKHFG